MSRQCTALPGGMTPHAQRSAATEVLIRRWQTMQDESAREVLIERYTPLSRKLARKYQGSWEILDDLMQVASIGLVNAINRYDTERGVRFESFAIPTILGELKRYLRDSGWAVHVPRALQERAVKVEQARRELSGQGQSPTYQQLAEYLEFTLEEVLDAVEATSAHHATSLETPRHDDGSGEGTITLADTLRVTDERYDRVEDAACLGACAAHLSERERYVLALRFVEDATQAEIAERIDLSQMQVSRILSRSLSRLEVLMRGHELAD